MLYEFECATCKDVQVVTRLMKDRGRQGPTCCGTITERIPSIPHVTPNSLYVEGRVASRGRKVLLNDYDDPWEGIPGLCAEQSEEFVARSREAKGQSSTALADRKSKDFDMGAQT